ncbi:hypothetical protein MLD52_17200 [Puniceicoccaceae bacterium K14]|nr:hypothetical protein [Puniceicoccaceae bacterium K14]
MNTKRHRLLKSTTLLFLYPIGVTLAFDPDPDIFDATKNGAGGNGNADQIQDVQTVNDPLGGMISVVDESQLPAIGQISGINLPIGQTGSGISLPIGQSGSSGSGVSMSGGSSGIPPIFGGGGGSGNSNGQQSSSLPFPQGQGGQSGESGQMQLPQGQGQSQGQIGNSPTGQFPPPPPDIPIGEQSGLEGSEIDTGEGSESSQKNQNSSKSSGSAESGDGKQGESDNQEMPGDMGNGQGSTRRGTGTEQGVQMPQGL